MAKKFSQFDIAAAIAGDESFVGLKDGDNSQFPFADVLSYFITGLYDNFWPLSGSAALTDDLIIDGDGNDILFENVDGFQIESTFDLTFIYDDGVATNTFSMTNNLGAGETLFDTNGQVIFTADDGVDTSSLTLGPDGLDIDIGGGGTFISFSPTAFSLQMLESDGTANISSDDFVNDTAYLGVNKNTGLTTNASSIGFIDSGGEYVDLHLGINAGSGVEAVFLDTRSSKRGIEYGADGYVTQDRSLTDRGFVNNAIAAALGGGGGSLALQTYTVATLPDEATNQDGLIVVTDESGGRTPAISDGTNWRRLYDMNIVS